ncbi:hypothetical protein QZH41_006605 [Actinostola sp. cb2023]|nr:hypothetical protein QZH41_006605 [Actinostola sp. cb2023]
MKLYLIAGLLAVLVVSGLSMDATQENEIPALLEFSNDFSAEDEIPALLTELTNDVSGEAKRGGGDVLHHLHCLELHKAGYCKYGLIRNKFCKKTCSCSDVLAQGCCKTLKNKNECASAWGMKYCHETCHKCFLCNIEPLGMQSKTIPDARITASSMWDGNHAPAQGRLNYKPPRGKAGSWSSRHNRVGQWIQVDLKRVTKVTGIATQGRTNANQWVTKYKLQYSSDGKTFNNYEGGKVFTANKDRNSVVKNNLYKPIIASVLRNRILPYLLHCDFVISHKKNEIPALLEFSNDFSAEDEMPALLNLANDVSGEAKRGGGDVLHHLHCLELHKAGYCKYGLIRNKFCKKTCSCSDVLAQGCCKTLKNKNECASAWGMKYCHETCHKCFLCNIEPLGMQSKTIPDARITASSRWDGNHAPAQGRLNYKPPRGKAGSWSSRHNRVGQWIQVDLKRVTKVTGIATQGRTNAHQWVTKYKLQYSSDGKTFNNYEGGKVFTANKDRNSVVKNNLYKPIIARRTRTDELHNKMKLYLIGGLLAVLVVSGLAMDATLENEIPALLEFSNDFSAEDEMPALLNLANDVSGEAKRGGGDVLHHLHCLELHKAGYCKYGLIRNKFCKKTCSCSDVLAQGCCKTLKNKNECASAWGMKYCHETCHKCFLCNIEPLGMQSKTIPDARITASSMWDGNHAPAQGRLNYKPPRGKAGSWSSRHNRVGQWIQVDLKRVTKVTGISTQGRTNANQWVTKYKLQYSSDGKTFNNYEGGKVFTANKDRNSVVKNNLYKPIIARLLKRLKNNTNLRAAQQDELYLIAGLLAVLVVSGLSMDATLENEIPALLEFTNDFSAEDEIPALLEFTNDFSAEDEIPALLNLANDVSEEAKRGGGDVLHHLHCLELHKAGYCKYGLIRNRFCKKTCSCSDVLAQGCCKTLKDKNECASAWGMKYCHETCHKCFLCNIEPLGMQSKTIPDARITASSMWDGNHAPAQGRLNYKPPRGKAGSWSSRHNRVGQWIQVDLNRVTKVTGIATQGRSNANQWVKKYKLQYSSDGKTFNNYEGGKVFTANKDRNSVVKHNLYKPIIARRTPRIYELHNKMKLYLIAGLLAVLVVPGLSMDATQENEIPALLEFTDDFSAEDEIPALLKLANDVSGVPFERKKSLTVLYEESSCRIANFERFVIVL